MRGCNPVSRTSCKRPLKMPMRIRPHNQRKICWDIVLNREEFKERKNSTPLPCPLHSKLGCLLFSWGSSRTAAQHCMEGVGEKKPHFPVLKSEKRRKSPLGRSYVATTNQRWRKIEACFPILLYTLHWRPSNLLLLAAEVVGFNLEEVLKRRPENLLRSRVV